MSKAFTKQWEVSAEPIEIYNQIKDVVAGLTGLYEFFRLTDFPKEEHLVISGKIYKMSKLPVFWPIGLWLIKRGKPCEVKLSSETQESVTFFSEGERVAIIQAISRDLDERFKWLNSIAEKSLQIQPSEITPEAAKTTMRCFKTGAPCPKDIEVNPQQAFIGIPFRPEFEDTYRYGVIPALKAVGLKPWKADERVSNIDIMCKVCEGIQSSKYAIINISDWNPNVLFELGLVYGLSRDAVIIKDRQSEVPTDLRGMEFIEYSNSDELREKLIKFFRGK